jgi:hypothetical protein
LDGVCRCEYPEEDVYGEVEGGEVEEYIVIADVTILPRSHEACENIFFFCPGQEVQGTPWSYDECPTTSEQNGERKRARLLRGQRRTLEAYRRPENVYDLPSEGGLVQRFPAALHHLMDGGGSHVSENAKMSYVVLPQDLCIDGVAETRSVPEGSPRECTNLELDFEKAEDGRPLAGGTFVARQWYQKYGIKITARSHQGPQNIYPLIFDSEDVGSNGIDREDSFSLASPNVDCGGTGVGGGGKLGQPGQNCETLSNLLIPSRRPGTPSLADAPDFGILVFEFYKITALGSISLLNVLGNESRLQVVQEDGSSADMALSSVGENGLHRIRIDRAGVKKLSVSLKSFTGIASLDLCILLPETH